MRNLVWLALLGTVLASCQQPDGKATAGAGDGTRSTPATTSDGGAQAMADGLKIEDLVVGSGISAVAGKQISVHYTGTFTNGQKFDSSLDSGQPLVFRLGTGRVIKGWDEGLVGMKIGGKRKLTVPPALGYGPNDYRQIPGNSTLLFEVEMIDIQP